MSTQPWPKIYLAGTEIKHILFFRCCPLGDQQSKVLIIFVNNFWWERLNGYLKKLLNDPEINRYLIFFVFLIHTNTDRITLFWNYLLKYIIMSFETTFYIWTTIFYVPVVKYFWWTSRSMIISTSASKMNENFSCFFVVNSTRILINFTFLETTQVSYQYHVLVYLEHIMCVVFM